MAAGLKVTPSALDELEARLLNQNGQVPLHDRFRALFTLKAIGGQAAVNIIAKGELMADIKAMAYGLTDGSMPWEGFSDPSALLKHELAYVLGQINDPSAIPILSDTLADTKEDPMVRHEAAEALGAISDYDSLPLLQKYLKDPERVAAEALGGIAEMDEDAPILIEGERVDVQKVLKEWMLKPDAPEVVKQSCQVAVDMWEYENSNQFQYANGLQGAAPIAAT
ncbi:deoxyhypusine hydroxylase [Tulasnella sp. 331]|nr:deoxyhypusine hydroxylase [Tulasnella sp. 331]